MSAGMMIGMPIGIFFTVLSVVFGIVSLIIFERKEIFLFTGGSLVLALFFGGLTAGLMYPYKYEYHHWIPVHGTVASTNSRLINKGGDKGMEQRFVVKLTDGRIRSCDDTRCADVKPGDQIALKCKKAWQFSGTDGWDCNWAGKE